MKFLGFLSFLIAFGICQSQGINITFDCPGNMIKDEATLQCYHFETEEPLTWDQAAEACRNMSALLLKVDDEMENEYVKNEMGCSTSYWIGLNDQAEDKVFEYVDRPDDKVKYTNWWPLEPSHQTPCDEQEEDCVEVNKYSLWNDASCDLKKNYVCEAEPVMSFSCPEDWIKNENADENMIACYLQTTNKTTHQEAKDNCIGNGGFLFYPTSIEEGLFVNSLASGDKYWIDVVKENNKWVFNDKTEEVLDTNWLKYEPTSWSNRNCVAARKSKPWWLINNYLGKWSNHKCTDLYNYVCKMEANEDSY